MKVLTLVVHLLGIFSITLQTVFVTRHRERERVEQDNDDNDEGYNKTENEAENVKITTKTFS